VESFGSNPEYAYEYGNTCVTHRHAASRWVLERFTLRLNQVLHVTLSCQYSFCVYVLLCHLVILLFIHCHEGCSRCLVGDPMRRLLVLIPRYLLLALLSNN